MLNYNQPIKEQKSYQGLQMSEIYPVMKLIIRGKKREFLSAIGKSLNIGIRVRKLRDRRISLKNICDFNFSRIVSIERIHSFILLT